MNYTTPGAYTERPVTHPHEDEYVEKLRAIRAEAQPGELRLMNHAEWKRQKLALLNLQLFTVALFAAICIGAAMAVVFVMGAPA